jgi:hypothetical protein
VDPSESPVEYEPEYSKPSSHSPPKTSDPEPVEYKPEYSKPTTILPIENIVKPSPKSPDNKNRDPYPISVASPEINSFSPSPTTITGDYSRKTSSLGFVFIIFAVALSMFLIATAIVIIFKLILRKRANDHFDELLNNSQALKQAASNRAKNLIRSSQSEAGSNTFRPTIYQFGYPSQTIPNVGYDQASSTNCIPDPYYPTINPNNEDEYPAQSFSNYHNVGYACNLDHVPNAAIDAVDDPSNYSHYGEMMIPKKVHNISNINQSNTIRKFPFIETNNECNRVDYLGGSGADIKEFAWDPVFNVNQFEPEPYGKYRKNEPIRKIN